jgi:hypothetical protein
MRAGKFQIFGIALLSVAAVSFMNNNSLKKKISGHWITNDFMGMYGAGDTLGINDTITFTKVKYDDKFYHWGGGAGSGMEFKGDSGFAQYQNVLCSDESDTKVGYDEKYFFASDSIIEVKSDLRDFKFRILKVDGKKLVIRVMK